VHRQLEPFVVSPRIQPARTLALEQLPAGQARLQRGLVVAKDPELEILVRPGDLAEEEVDRPAPGDEPRPAEGRQRLDRTDELVEAAQASFSRTS
jgi:hypothetical protein